MLRFIVLCVSVSLYCFIYHCKISGIYMDSLKVTWLHWSTFNRFLCESHNHSTLIHLNSWLPYLSLPSFPLPNFPAVLSSVAQLSHCPIFRCLFLLPRFSVNQWTLIARQKPDQSDLLYGSKSPAKKWVWIGIFKLTAHGMLIRFCWHEEDKAGSC